MRGVRRLPAMVLHCPLDGAGCQPSKSSELNMHIQFRGPKSRLGLKDQVPLLAAFSTRTARGLHGDQISFEELT